MTDAPRVRRARDDDLAAVAPLLHSAAVGMYELMSGTRERALRAIARDLGHGGARSTWVAELDGRVAGAMVAFPYGEAPLHARRLLRALLRHSPPWRWPAVVRLHAKGQRIAPDHPADWLYVDALATDPALRRRGVATALLAQAERSAASAGLRAIALDTPETNAAALALYRSAGYRIAELLPSAPPVPAAAILVKELS